MGIVQFSFSLILSCFILFFSLQVKMLESPGQRLAGGDFICQAALSTTDR